MKKLYILLLFLFLVFAFGFRMHDKTHLTTLASNDSLLVEDASDANVTKYTTITDLKTYFDDFYCLESVLGTSIGTGILLDGTVLKTSVVLQKYHGIDPSPNVQTMLGSADNAAIKANIDTGLPSRDFILAAPTILTDFLVWRAPSNITITKIYGVSQSGVVIVGGLDECDSAGANPVAVDADITFNGGLDQDDGSLTNPSIDAGDWIRWHTTSTDTSGYGYLTVTFDYTID